MLRQIIRVSKFWREYAGELPSLVRGVGPAALQFIVHGGRAQKFNHENRKTPISKPAENAQRPNVHAETRRARLRRSASFGISQDRSVIAAPLRWPLRESLLGPSPSSPYVPKRRQLRPPTCGRSVCSPAGVILFRSRKNGLPIPDFGYRLSHGPQALATSRARDLAR